MSNMQPQVKGVRATVESVSGSGWAVAKITSDATSESGAGVRVGETISVQPRHDVKRGDALHCVVVLDSSSRTPSCEWFATSVSHDRPRASNVKWDTWQDGSRCLSLDLPDTVSGTNHDGIDLLCWKCGQLLVADFQIHKIKGTCVWTNTDDVVGEILVDRVGQYNEYKRTEFFPVKCGGCKAKLATLYKTPFYDRDLGGPTDENTQPTPCLKVTTVFRRRGDASYTVVCVLDGDSEASARDAIKALTETEEWRLRPANLPRTGRVDRDTYAENEMRRRRAAGED
jgi:hypothetical protein